MEKYSINSNGITGTQFETPFADVTVLKEQSDAGTNSEDFFSGFLSEVESPFSRTYEVPSSTNRVTEAGEAYTELLAELNDSEFNEVVYELVNEVEDTWRNKVSNELAMGNNYIPFVTRQANNYFQPMIRETDAMIDRIAQHFSANNLADHTQSEVEQFFETLEFSHDNYTPAQDQFFGKIFNKVKSVVKKGVELAKKGINVVGKLLPVNIILDRIKGLVRPLLDKVLRFAIGKLPKNLQPYAQTLSKKFLNLEAPGTISYEAQDEVQLEAIQTELDHHLAHLLFSSEEESANSIVNYETSLESLERADNYETGSLNIPSLDVARQQFVDDLKNLKEGESPAPAIERFLPAVIVALQPVIKMAIGLIGRQKIINFLAGLLAKLVSKYVPANVAQPLAANIIDIGMKAIGFEVHETGKTDLAYEAIANTIQETVQNMNGLNEASLNDSEELTLHLLEAFEKAAADNFPAQYIKEDLRPSKQKAIWISMPRTSPVKLYKKFTHVYDITIDPQTASSVTTYRNLPLSNFLRDKYGLDTSKPVKAKLHLYEIKKSGRISMISHFEKLPGLNSAQTKAWVQLLPLTKQAASVLLKEPALGRDVDAKTLASRFRAKAGQRFYYLEIEGVRLRIPQVNRSKHKHVQNARPSSSTESRSADVQAVINFIKNEIALNYYFSEEDAMAVVEKLNKNDAIGVAMGLRQSIKNLLNDMLLKNVSGKVKIVHEAVPELYLENFSSEEENVSATDVVGKLAGKEVIKKLVEKIIDKISSLAYNALGSFFKSRAAEFKQAQAQPQDGVTVKLVWKNVSGMSSIRTAINAIRGDWSVGNLSDLSLPSFSAPEIQIEADKKFD